MGRARLRGMLASSVPAAAASLAISAALLFAGCAPSARPQAAKPVRISLCGGALQRHPAVITVVCSNNSISARNLRWSDWGGSIATATGSAVVDLCAYEDCYAGEYVTVPIVIITSKITRCPAGTRAYSRLQYVFVGRSPYAGLSAAVSIPEGSTRPANPGDQTVSLVC